MRPTPDPTADYSPDAIVTSEELRRFLRMTAGEWLRLRTRRAWAEPLYELPPPVLGGHSGAYDALRWRMRDVYAWLEGRAAGYERGDL